MNERYSPQTENLTQLGVGLKAYFRISDEWGLDDEQRYRLLGDPNRERFINWESGVVEADDVSAELLDRLSYILGIYKTLKIMHSDENQRLFLKHTTKLEQFNYDSPLNYMLNGSLAALADIRRYLEDQFLGKLHIGEGSHF